MAGTPAESSGGPGHPRLSLNHHWPGILKHDVGCLRGPEESPQKVGPPHSGQRSRTSSRHFVMSPNLTKSYIASCAPSCFANGTPRVPADLARLVF